MLAGYSAIVAGWCEKREEASLIAHTSLHALPAHQQPNNDNISM
jgi:hypothetical protein